MCKWKSCIWCRIHIPWIYAGGAMPWTRVLYYCTFARESIGHQWYPSQGANNAELWRLCCWPEDVLEQTLELSEIWDALKLTCHCCYHILHAKIHTYPSAFICFWNTTNRTSIWTQRARFMGPTWGPSGADRTQVGPMLVPWTLLSG